METWIPVLLCTSGNADLRIANQEMRRLILLMDHPAVVHIGHFVEGVGVVELHLVRWMRVVCSEITLNALHSLVTSHSLQSVSQSEPPPPRHHPQSRIDHAKEIPMLETLMEVPLEPQLFSGPRLLEKPVVLREDCF